MPSLGSNLCLSFTQEAMEEELKSKDQLVKKMGVEVEQATPSCGSRWCLDLDLDVDLRKDELSRCQQARSKPYLDGGKWSGDPHLRPMWGPEYM